MKTVTKLATAVALSTTMSVSAFAETKTPVTVDTPVANTVAINHADLSYAFGSSNPDLQVLTMNGQQMQETEGAVAPLVE